MQSLLEPVDHFANYPMKKVRERKKSFTGKKNPNKIDVFVADSQIQTNSEARTLADCSLPV